jgi:hypothetical protein
LDAIVIFVLGGALGILGEHLRLRGRLKELETRDARQDHEHRQGYYHRLLAVEQQLRELAFHGDPDEQPGTIQFLEARFTEEITGLISFGPTRTRDAVRQLRIAYFDDHDEEAMRSARDAVEEAAAADVAPD